MTKHQTKTAKDSVALRFIIGLISGIAAAGVSLALCAWITAKLDLTVTALPMLSAVCFWVGGFTFGFMTGFSHGKKGVVIGLFCGAIWLILLCCGNLLIHQASFEGMTLIKAGVGMLLCIFGGALGKAAVIKRQKHRYTS